MKEVVAALLTTTFAIAWTFMVVNDQDSSPGVRVVSINTTWAEPEITGSNSPSYETDPDLVAFSRSIQETPGCVLAVVKLQFDRVDPSGLCDDSEQRGRRATKPRPTKLAQHRPPSSVPARSAATLG